MSAQGHDPGLFIHGIQFVRLERIVKGDRFDFAHIENDTKVPFESEEGATE